MDNGTGFISQEFEGRTGSAIPSLLHTIECSCRESSADHEEGDVGRYVNPIAKVLFMYRITPQSTTGSSAADLLLGRRPPTRLDLLRPNTAERVGRKQEEQKAGHEKKARVRTF